MGGNSNPKKRQYPFNCSGIVRPYKCEKCSFTTHDYVQKLNHYCSVYRQCDVCKIGSYSEAWSYFHSRRCKIKDSLPKKRLHRKRTLKKKSKLKRSQKIINIDLTLAVSDQDENSIGDDTISFSLPPSPDVSNPMVTQLESTEFVITQPNGTQSEKAVLTPLLGAKSVITQSNATSLENLKLAAAQPMNTASEKTKLVIAQEGSKLDICLQNSDITDEQIPLDSLDDETSIQLEFINSSKDIVTPDNLEPNCKEDSSFSLAAFMNAQVTVIKNKKNQRFDRQNHFCLFCRKDVSAFSRHLCRNHKNEAMVQQILALPLGSVARRKLLDNLRKEGDFMSAKKEIRMVKRPRKLVKPANILACVYCKGFYVKKYLYKHLVICSSRPKVKPKKPVNISDAQTYLAFHCLDKNIIGDLRLDEEILKMKCDSVSLIAKSDILILCFGSYHISRPQDVAVKNRVRELARLYQEMKPHIEDKDMLDALKPENFKLLISSTQKLAGLNRSIGIFEKNTTLPYKMRRTLLKLCQYAFFQIKNNNRIFTTGRDCLQKLNDIKKLKSLIENHWMEEMDQVSSKLRKSYEVTLLSLTSDVVNFKKYIEQEAQKLATELREKPDDRNIFFGLQRCCYALLLILNKTRNCELEALKLSNYLHREPDEFEKSLKESEIYFEKTYERFYIKIKNKKLISLLFSKELLDYIDLLLSCRKRFIFDQNLFLFAEAERTLCLNGYNSVKLLSSAAGVENCRGLISNVHRKSVATIFQIANLNSIELDELCALLDYTLPTHQVEGISREIYQIANLTNVLLTDEVTTAGLNDIDQNGGNDGCIENSMGECNKIKDEGGDRTKAIQNKNADSYSIISDLDEEEGGENDNEKDLFITNTSTDLKKKIHMGKKYACPFCKKIVHYFHRHLFKQHESEKVVQFLKLLPEGSVERRRYINHLGKKAALFPSRHKQVKFIKTKPIGSENVLLCIFCKGYYKKDCLATHIEKCVESTTSSHEQSNYLNSQNQLENRSFDETFLNSFDLKKKVLSMPSDYIVSLIVETDPLILSYGSFYAKMCKSDRSNAVIKKKLLELARLWSGMMPNVTGKHIFEALKPENFKCFVQSTRKLSRCITSTENGGTNSLITFEMRDTLETLCDQAVTEIQKKNKVFVENLDCSEKIKQLNHLKMMLQRNWEMEMELLKNQYLKNRKQFTISSLLLDIQKFIDYIKHKANNCVEKLKVTHEIQESQNMFMTLQKCCLTLFLMSNSIQSDDFKELKLKSYINCQSELEENISDVQKILFKNYKRLSVKINDEKILTLLFSKEVIKYIDTLMSVRKRLIPETNPYLFANVNSNLGLDGQSTMQTLAQTSGIEYPEVLTLPKLREYVVTISQVKSLHFSDFLELSKLLEYTLVQNDSRGIQDNINVAKLVKLILKLKDETVDVNNMDEVLVSDEDFDDERDNIYDVPKSMKTTLLAENRVHPTELLQLVSNFDLKGDNHGKRISKQKIKNKKSVIKIKWTEEQKELTRRFFKNHILNRKPPIQREVKQFKQLFPCMDNKDWKKIKVFVWNEYKRRPTVGNIFDLEKNSIDLCLNEQVLGGSVTETNSNIKRTTEQEQATLEYWKQNIQENIEPTATEVPHSKTQYFCMNNKTRAKIKAFILDKHTKTEPLENNLQPHEDKNNIYLNEQGFNTCNPKALRTYSKIRWTLEQKQVTVEYFKENILKNIVPTETDVDDFKKQYSCMENKSWANVKAFVLNEYRRTAVLENKSELQKDGIDLSLTTQDALTPVVTENNNSMNNWTTEQKQVTLEYFKQNSRGKLDEYTTAELQNVFERHEDTNEIFSHEQDESTRSAALQNSSEPKEDIFLDEKFTDISAPKVKINNSKVKWTTEQKRVLVEYFKENIRNNKLPTEAEVTDFTKLHFVMKKKGRANIIKFVLDECTRTAALQNVPEPEIVKNEIFSNEQSPNQVTDTSTSTIKVNNSKIWWTKEQKRILVEYFKENIQQNKPPTELEVIDFTRLHPSMKNKSRAKIIEFVSDECTRIVALQSVPEPVEIKIDAFLNEQFTDTSAPKIKWTIEQKRLLVEFFKENIRENKAPTESEVTDFTKIHFAMKKKGRANIIKFVLDEAVRTAALHNVLGPEEVNNQAFLNEQSFDKVTETLTPAIRANNSKVKWTTKEKRVLVEYFKENISNNKAPTELEVANFTRLHSFMKRKGQANIIEFVLEECTRIATLQNISKTDKDNEIAPHKTQIVTVSNSNSKLKWTENQKQITVQYFQENIRKKKAPTKTEIEIFKEEYSCMNNKDWKKIKTFIFEYSRDTDESYLLSNRQDIYTPTVRRPIPKIRWTIEQKEVTVAYFKENIQKSKPPTEAEVEDFKRKFRCMDNKDWKKIKAFIFNEYSKKTPKHSDLNDKDQYSMRFSPKIRWTTEQKQVTLKYFEENIRSNKSPTETEVKYFKRKYPCMENKDWKKIKVFVFNQYNKPQTAGNLF